MLATNDRVEEAVLAESRPRALSGAPCLGCVAMGIDVSTIIHDSAVTASCEGASLLFERLSSRKILIHRSWAV